MIPLITVNAALKAFAAFMEFLSTEQGQEVVKRWLQDTATWNAEVKKLIEQIRLHLEKLK